MMIREEIQIIENRVAGQDMIIRPSVGRTWADIHLEHGSITLAQLTNIRVQLVSSSKTVDLMTFASGTELNELNKRYGRHVAAGTLSFYFRRPEMESEVQRMATALGTGGLDAIRVVASIDAAAVVGTVQAWGSKAANRNVSEGLLMYTVGTNKGGAVAGDNHFDDLNRRDRLAALHILNDKVLSVEVRADDATAHDMTIARNNFDELAAFRVPYGAAYGYVVDFQKTGNLAEALVLNDGSRKVGQLRVTSELGASPAATIRYLAEYLSNWGSLTGLRSAS